MSDFAQLEQAFHEHFTRDGNQRVYLGVDRDLGELPDPSLADGHDRVVAARALLRQLDTLDSDGLDADQALDVQLAYLALEREILFETYTFNGRTRRQQEPRAGDEIGDGLFYLLVRDNRPDAARLTNVLERLRAVPAYLDAMLARLDRPVQRWVAMELERVAELPGFFASLGDWADEAGFADADALKAAAATAEDALKTYAAELARLPTTTQLHVGREVAEAIVRARGVEQPLEWLHATAKAFLARNDDTVESLRERLVRKYELPEGTSAADLQKHLAERWAVSVPDGDLDGILARYEQERVRIDAFIAERDLFPIPADQDMKILRTPKFMEPGIPAGAMCDPPPFREGTRTSLIYLTLREDLLDEHTELSIPGMMIHEGIPGHHLQLATACRHPSVVRRHTEAMDLHEGWTTMLEDWMLDAGYMGELEDEARFVGQRDIARIGARVAIDLYFMTGDEGFLEVGVPCDLSSSDPFEKAGSLLAAVTGFVPGRVQAELNWYSQERGYPLSYLTGNRLVWELKADMARHHEGQLEGLELDRAFHRAFLEAGNMPVAFLRRHFEGLGLVARQPEPSA